MSSRPGTADDRKRRRRVPRLEAKYKGWRKAVSLRSARIHIDLKTYWVINELLRDHSDDIREWSTFLRDTRDIYFERAVLGLWAIAADPNSATASIPRMMHFVQSNCHLFSKTAVEDRARKNHGNVYENTKRRHPNLISQSLLTKERLQELNDVLTAIESPLASIREWRHSQLAHLNLQVARGERDLAAEFPLTFGQLKEVFERCGHVCCALYAGYDLTGLRWGVGGDVTGQIEDLVSAAITGTKARQG